MIEASRLLLAIFVGTFGLALVAELTSRRFLCARLIIRGGPMTAIRAEMPGIFVLFTSISCFHVGGPPLDFNQEDFDSLQLYVLNCYLLLKEILNFSDARHPASTFL